MTEREGIYGCPPPMTEGKAMGKHSVHTALYRLDAQSDLDAWQTEVIRSHRRQPMHTFRRPLAVMLVITAAAVLMNSSAIPDEPVQPAASAAWQPAKPGDTPGALIPGEGDIPPPIDAGDDRGNSKASRGSVRVAAEPAVPVSKIEIVISYALAQQGDRYVFGGAGPNAFDCSGLVMMAFQQVGISLPHWTGTMINRGQRVSRQAMQRGDIVFLSDHHVALYLGGGKMVAASSGKGRVVIQTVYAFYAARRIL